MKQGKLLTIKDIEKLKPSDKQYYVESNNMYAENGVYILEDSYYFHGDIGNSFHVSCFSLQSGDIEVYELI